MSVEMIWLLLGIVLVFSELMLPGLVIIFFGIGALATSLLTWQQVTTDIHSQLLAFIGVSVLTLGLLRRYFRHLFGAEAVPKEETSTNFTLELGKIVPVVEWIDPDELGGKVRYHGTMWAARSEDKLAPGESARIVGCDNLTLIVEKVKEEKHG